MAVENNASSARWIRYVPSVRDRNSRFEYVTAAPDGSFQDRNRSGTRRRYPVRTTLVPSDKAVARPSRSYLLQHEKIPIIVKGVPKRHYSPVIYYIESKVVSEIYSKFAHRYSISLDKRTIEVPSVRSSYQTDLRTLVWTDVTGGSVWWFS